MDESNLPFKQIPSRTYAPKEYSQVPGVKKQMEKFTFAGCCNADGSLKLPLIVIGKSKNPRCLKDCMTRLPVWYRNQKSAFMDKIIFEEWFRNEFVPIVENFLISINLPPVAVLFLDNCRAHFYIKVREIEVSFYPPNVTSLIQPMDQGIIQATKLKYQKKFLTSIVEAEKKDSNLIDHLKTVTIKNAIEWIAESWDEVQPRTISKCWNKIWPLMTKDVATQTDETAEDIFSLSEGVECEKVDSPESLNSSDLRALLNIFKTVSGYESTQSTDVLNWLENTRETDFCKNRLSLFFFNTKFIYIYVASK